MDLKLQLGTVKGDDQMIRDSKKSIAKEIVQFLEMVDGFRGKKHQFTTRKIRNAKLVRSNCGIARDGRRLSERGVVSKCQSMDRKEKKLIANLREKVERISWMSRALEDEEVSDEETEGYEHVGDESGAIIDQITNNNHLKMGLPIENDAHISNAKKHGCFVEDRSVVWVTNEDVGTPLETQDEAKAQSDGGLSLQSDESCDNEDREFTFSVPEPVKIGPRAGLMMRLPGVKIVG